jgi:hypothetical protein
MRSVALVGALFIASAVNAQKLSLTPQVGFENSRTSVDYNNLGSFVPIKGNFNPQVSLRLDYKFKQGFGAYVGASTSRSVVLYSFNDIDNGMNLYNSSRANMQFRLEAGYLFTTNPINFNKGKASLASSSKTRSESKSSCCSYSKSYSSGCCRSKNGSSRKVDNKNNGGWVRLQPSVGLGLIPSPKTDIISKTQGGETTYEYRAGNWNTALMTGIGFEFGRNKQRLVNVSVNHFTGIGNMNKQTVSTISGSKMSVANLESNASGWNMRIGIPFTLADKGLAKHKTERTKRSGCGERVIMEYKYRCRQ